MFEVTVPCNPQVATVLTPSLSAATHAMGQLGAPETKLMDILYIHTMPYIPSAWI